MDTKQHNSSRGIQDSENNNSREKANTGDWDDLRDLSNDKKGNNNPATNDTGGAGSIGNTATNS